MHGVTGPDDIRALFLHGLDQTRQVFPHIAGPETREEKELVTALEEPLARESQERKEKTLRKRIKKAR